MSSYSIGPGMSTVGCTACVDILICAGKRILSDAAAAIARHGNKKRWNDRRGRGVMCCNLRQPMASLFMRTARGTGEYERGDDSLEGLWLQLSKR